MTDYAIPKLERVIKFLLITAWTALATHSCVGQASEDTSNLVLSYRCSVRAFDDI